jgi:hypothetical protein
MYSVWKTPIPSYFEGEHNELADYGYNHDSKQGEQQIVIGLLTGADDEPLAVRVFEDQCADPAADPRLAEGRLAATGPVRCGHRRGGGRMARG